MPERSGITAAILAILAFAGVAAVPSFLKKANAKAKPIIEPKLEPSFTSPARPHSGLNRIFKKPEAPRLIMDLDLLYEKWGQRYGVDPKLLKALAIVESSEQPNAKNPADPSFGLMQILCVNDGLDNPCKNKFNIEGWEGATPNRLFNPDFNVSLGAQIIAWNVRTYGFKRGIATYNRWASRKDPADGPFGNQRYVDKVLREYRALGGKES